MSNLDAASPAMEDARRVGIIGGGSVGKALERGLARAQWPVRIAPRDLEGQRAIAKESDIVVLAVPFGARRDVADKLGDLLEGKIVVDVTNPLKFPGPEYDSAGPDSGAEELQRWLPGARVVKAFNTVFSAFLSDGRVGEERLSAFVAADDEDAREAVLDLARAIGFDAVDAGPLSNARWLEGLLYLEMMLEKVHGSAIGVRFVRAPR